MSRFSFHFLTLDALLNVIFLHEKYEVKARAHVYMPHVYVYTSCMCSV